MARYSAERWLAIEAVLKSCAVCQEVQSRLVQEDTLTKKDRSPVTVADFSSQAVISLELQAQFPADPIVAEETAKDLVEQEDLLIKNRVVHFTNSIMADVNEKRILQVLDRGNHGGGAQGRFWSIDPIDGTKGFIRGDQYAISLSLIEAGEVVVGVLGCPNYCHDWSHPHGKRGALFVAVKDQGSFMRALGSADETALQVSPVTQASEAVLCESVESGHSSHSHSKQIAQRLGLHKPPFRIDSQCKYAALACSDASVYLRLPTRADYQEKIWDHAAGWLILKEAKGQITDIHGQALDFSQGRTLRLNTGILATNGAIHSEVLDAVKSVIQ